MAKKHEDFVLLLFISLSCTAAAPVFSIKQKIAVGLMIAAAGIAFLLILIKRKRNKKAVATADRDAVTITLGAAMGSPKNYSFSFLNKIGKRSGQEDAYGFSDYSDTQIVKQHGFLAIIADGMGGMKNGKDVSERTVKRFLQDFNSYSMSGNIPQQLLDTAAAVNKIVFSRDQMKSGSTLVAVLIFQDKAYWICIGDSALYLFRDGSLYQVNREHNHLNDLFLDYLYGRISDEEVINSPQRNGLTSNIGRDRLEKVDQNFIPLDILSGDKLLLCSDGISGCLSDEEMIAALQADSPNTCCDQIHQLVMQKKNPHQDNYTAEVIFCK